MQGEGRKCSYSTDSKKEEAGAERGWQKAQEKPRCCQWGSGCGMWEQSLSDSLPRPKPEAGVGIRQTAKRKRKAIKECGKSTSRFRIPCQHRRVSESPPSDSGFESLDRSMGGASVRLFNRERTVHQILGGGAVADVLLWRQSNATVGILVSTLAAWLVFEKSGYTLVSLVSSVLLLLFVILFLWANAAAILGRPAPPLPSLQLSEDFMNEAATFIHSRVNALLAVSHDIALGKNPMLFLKVAAWLWLISIVGGWTDFLTLGYTSLVIILTVPTLYEKYEDPIDKYSVMALEKLGRLYARLDEKYLCKMQNWILEKWKLELFLPLSGCFLCNCCYGVKKYQSLDGDFYSDGGHDAPASPGIAANKALYVLVLFSNVISTVRDAVLTTGPSSQRTEKNTNFYVYEKFRVTTHSAAFSTKEINSPFYTADNGADFDFDFAFMEFTSFSCALSLPVRENLSAVARAERRMKLQELQSSAKLVIRYLSSCYQIYDVWQMQRASRCARRILSRPFHNFPCQQQSWEQDLHRFSQEGRLKDAIRVLQRSNPTHIHVHPETYLRLIRSCIKFKYFKEGREIHKHIIESGLQPDVALCNHIINLYSKCGDLRFARELFDKMGERNLYSWAAIIGACLNAGEFIQAFEFYERMIFADVIADRFLYPLLLKSCGKMQDSRRGRRIHANVMKSGFVWDVVVLNSLIDMYSKCECVVDAEKVFCEMEYRDSFTWTTMLVGYVQAGCGQDALDFFRRMMDIEVRPCSAIFAGILPVFSRSCCLDFAKQIHGLIVVSGFESDRFVGSGLVDMYTNCGGLGYGHLVFERVKERDIACWNAMIKGYSQRGLFDEAIKLLIQMHGNRVNPNKVTWECFMTAVVQSGSINNILGIIKRLESGGVRPNLTSISSLLKICESPDVVHYVKELEQYLVIEGYLSDKTMASLFLNFYLKFANFDAANDIFKCIGVKELGDWNSMISSYANSRQGDIALELFHSMREDGIEPDIVSWNSVMDGLVRSFDFEGAMGIFEEMKWSKQRPDSKSFEIILPVLANLTCLRTGKELHNMFFRHECKMNHYISTALMNMYGNCRDTDYAKKIFNSMYSKDIVAWNTLISVLAKNGFINEALKTFDNMEMEGQKANVITWTTLISVHVQNGQVDDSFKYFRQLQMHGLKPNSFTIASILPACAQSATLCHGKAIHGYSIRSLSIYNDMFIANSLMDMFIKCGSLAYAECIFGTLLQRDIITWNTMITGYIVHGKSDSSLALFNEMLGDGIVPDSITFVGVLSACSHSGLIDEGWKQFNTMSTVYGIVPSGKHYTCMVDMLGRAGQFETALNFIIQMPLQPTASLWGALLFAAKTHRNVEMAEYAAKHLLELQPNDPGNYVILSNIYASQKRWNDADRVRKMMLDHGVKQQHGCSWIEVRNQIHAFPVENPSHPDMEVINQILHDLAIAMWEEDAAVGNPRIVFKGDGRTGSMKYRSITCYA
ncbi:hypothetical protein H6P81_006170 [Aristolochia fimbriata]|uniref:Reticulon-like protein n=1 Tax=Aristolochia fimbriata TaxID=158543 RepID=A0AAV7EZE0_ARIFI|nr:hypothetical protein H6P81_006170 [Aristolochia fimbriata]